MRKRLLAVFLVIIMGACPGCVHAAWDICDALTGGADGAVDGIDGANLSDGDVVIAIVEDSGVYHYVVDGSCSACVESVPKLIIPDVNPGTKGLRLEEAFAKIIAADTTYYVDPSGGSDTTGNGTAGAPWATIPHAVQSLNAYYWDVSAVDITIQVANGTIALTSDIVIDHSCGRSLYIYGDRTAGASYAINGTGETGGIDYVTISGDHSAEFPADSSLTISSDTNNNGLYLVSSSSYSDPNTTIYLTSSTALMDDTAGDGNVNSMPWTYGVIIDPTDGITSVFNVKTNIGGIDGFTLDNNSGNTDYGVFAEKNGNAIVGPKMLVRDFDKGYYANDGGSIYSEYTAAYSCTDGYFARDGGRVHASYSYSNANSGDGYHAERGGYVISVFSYAKDNAGSGFEATIDGEIMARTAISQQNGSGFYADYGSYIFAHLAAVDGNTVDYSPTPSTSGTPLWGNNGSTILGGSDITPTTTANDESFVIRPAASKTCNAAAKGALHCDSDDNELYFCNGTNWEQLSP